MRRGASAASVRRCWLMGVASFGLVVGFDDQQKRRAARQT
jgi:hypothetical protein